MIRLLRAFLGVMDPTPVRCYDVGNAGATMLWLIQARKIGASLDQLARGLR